MVNTACAKGLFAKATRRRVAVPADLADLVERQLTRRCLDLVGLARRAGQAVAGYEKARQWLLAGKAGVVLAAADGAPASRGKIGALAPELPEIDLFSGEELGAVWGVSGRYTWCWRRVAWPNGCSPKRAASPDFALRPVRAHRWTRVRWRAHSDVDGYG